MDVKILGLVALGGALGSVARFLVSGWASRIEPHIAGTIAVNVIGCFLIGLLLFSNAAWMTPSVRALLTIGFLGGFTTMSSFSYETIALFEAQRVNLAFTNIALTFATCLGATWLGRAMALIVRP